MEYRDLKALGDEFKAAIDANLLFHKNLQSELVGLQQHAERLRALNEQTSRDNAAESQKLAAARQQIAAAEMQAKKLLEDARTEAGKILAKATAVLNEHVKMRDNYITETKARLAAAISG